MRNSFRLAIFWAALVMGPLLVAFRLHICFPLWIWANEPFHSSLEAAGSVIALSVATFVLLQKQYQEKVDFPWISLALISMGIIDGAHAVEPVGTAFVWTRALATLIGGLLFAQVWIPASISETISTRKAVYVTLLICVTLVLFSSFFPELLPAMTSNGSFTLTAKILNFGGGVGFGLGCLYYFKRDNILFASHCGLFAIAAFMFSFAHLWGAVWWFFHIVRFFAYLVVFRYVLAGAVSAIQDMAQLQIAKSDVRTRDEFILICSHELKTPITAMKLQMQTTRRYLNKVPKNEANDDFRDRLEHIVDLNSRQLDRLVRLIDDMLDVTRASRGELAMSFSRIDLVTITQDVLQRFNEQLLETPLHCSFPHYAWIRGDAQRIEQVITNLISNAIKYGNSEPITIEISRVGGFYRWSIRDQGIGIAAENLNRIFDRFERAVSANQISGMGLGLYITRNIVETHRGRILVESSFGKGSTFIVELPRVP